MTKKVRQKYVRVKIIPKLTPDLFVVSKSNREYMTTGA